MKLKWHGFKRSGIRLWKSGIIWLKVIIIEEGDEWSIAVMTVDEGISFASDSRPTAREAFECAEKLLKETLVELIAELQRQMEGL